MPMVPITRSPGWAITAARTHRGDIQRIAAEGFQVLELLGGMLAAMAIGAAVLGALPEPVLRADT